MFKFSKFILTLFSLLLIWTFSFGSSQHSKPLTSSSDHPKHNEHNQANMHNHQNESMSQMLAEDVDVKFTLAASFFDRKRVFVGVSPNIRGQINPVLEVPQGAVVEITLLNDTVRQHNLVIPDLSFHSKHIEFSDSATFTFHADLESGSSLPYYCTVDNHNIEGMEGVIAIK